MLKTFCQNIEKASDCNITLNYSDYLYIDYNSTAFKRKGNNTDKGDLKTCLYYELNNKNYIDSLLILDFQLFRIYDFDDHIDRHSLYQSKLQLNIRQALFL